MATKSKNTDVRDKATIKAGADWLRGLIKEKFGNQGQFSRATNFPHSSLRQWVTMGQVPSAFVENFCRHLDIAVKDFLAHGLRICETRRRRNGRKAIVLVPPPESSSDKIIKLGRSHNEATVQKVVGSLGLTLSPSELGFCVDMVMVMQSVKSEYLDLSNLETSSRLVTVIITALGLHQSQSKTYQPLASYDFTMGQHFQSDGNALPVKRRA